MHGTLAALVAVRRYRMWRFRVFWSQDNSVVVYGRASNVHRKNQVPGPEDTAWTDQVDVGSSQCR